MLTFKGDDVTRKRLLALSRSMRNRILYLALMRGIRPVAKAAKSNAPLLSSTSAEIRPELEDLRGLLKKSIGFVVRVHGKEPRAKAIVGARRGFRVRRSGDKVFSKWGAKLREARKENDRILPPDIYIRFVEGGTDHAGPMDFLRQTWAQTGAQAVRTTLEVIREKIAEQLRSKP